MNTFTLIDKAQIDRLWPVISEVLEPAIRPAPTVTMQDVYQSLAHGRAILFQIEGDADGLMVLEIDEDRCCWIKWVAGDVSGGPKARANVCRAITAHIETVAMQAGCTEVRVCGRDWSVILTDYELTDDCPNGLRKVLAMKDAA